MLESPKSIDYASVGAQSRPPGMFLLVLPFLLFVVTGTLSAYFWIANDFIPIHREVFSAHRLTEFDAIYGRFLDLCTPTFFALPTVGITFAIIYLRRRRTSLAWTGLALNILTFTALMILAVTRRDYPRSKFFFLPSSVNSLDTSRPR